MSLFLTVSFISLIPLLVILFSKWRYSFWKRRGVVQLNPEFFYGDLRGMLSAKISIGEAIKNVYFTFKNKKVGYGGIYWAFKPEFVPVDIQLIKDIMQKSFSNFQDRGFYSHKKDVLTQTLFRMQGDAWKELRVKLTPTFTSSKMKMMFETLSDKMDGFKNVIGQCIQKGGKINITDISARFTTDVIGSCAFGIECNSMQNPDCEFREYGKKINQPNALKQWMENIVPRSLLIYTGFRSFPQVEQFFKNLVLETIDFREKNEIFRKDFMHLLLQLRNRGVLSDDGKITKDQNKTGTLTDDEILAQCFLFFGAGFDTSSATIAYAMYELAKHPDIQETIREEIRQVFKKYGGNLTYEGAKDLVFTEQVISETLRKYPILPSIPRVCTKDYKVPDSKVVVKKGTILQIPVWGIHMDPEYYPNPEVFDPERFNEENKANRPEFSYLPFGEGPRVCIGARFGMLQTKIGLVGFLKDNKYTLSKDSPQQLSYKPSMILLHALEEVWLNVEEA